MFFDLLSAHLKPYRPDHAVSERQQYNPYRKGKRKKEVFHDLSKFGDGDKYPTKNSRVWKTPKP